jgi:prepilin peptidase CpaA
VTDFLYNLSTLLYLGGLAAAAVCDVASLTIPNRLVLLVAAAALVGLAVVAPDRATVFMVLGAGVGVLVVGAVLFFVGVWGAGDAKLLAAAVLATGPSGLGVLLFWTAVVGGGLALILLFLRYLRILNRRRFMPRGAALLSAANGIPYGVAIAAGGTIAYLDHVTLLSGQVFGH